MIDTFLLGGCAHEQKVSNSYPSWGEEVILEGAENRPTPLIVRFLEPLFPVEPRACLLLVHGMNEYIGRYREIAEYFASSYQVAGFDLFAHGLSNPVIAAANTNLAHGVSEADVSQAYIAQADLRDLTPLRHDLDLALRLMLDRCPDRAVFIISHSLGSLIAASYLLSNCADQTLQTRIGGIVLLGPAFAVPDIPGWRGWLQNPAINLSFAAESASLHAPESPWWTRLSSRAAAVPCALLLRGLFEALSWPGIRSLVTPVTPDWVPDFLSDWEEERQRHRIDGYIIRRTLLRYAKAVEKEIVHFRYAMAGFGIPYLLIYSDHDPITPAWGNENFLRATSGNHPANESWRLRNQNFHEHLFASPPLRRKVLRRIDEWLDRRLATLAASTPSESSDQ